MIDLLDSDATSEQIAVFTHHHHPLTHSIITTFVIIIVHNYHTSLGGSKHQREC